MLSAVRSSQPHHPQHPRKCGSNTVSAVAVPPVEGRPWLPVRRLVARAVASCAFVTMPAAQCIPRSQCAASTEEGWLPIAEARLSASSLRLLQSRPTLTQSLQSSALLLPCESTIMSSVTGGSETLF